MDARPLAIYCLNAQRGVYRAPSGRLVIVYNYMHAGEIRPVITQRLYDLTHRWEGRDYWFRATDNPNEHKRCRNMRSKNHADGTMERGLSVSEHPHYQALGYRYIYVVTGRLVGYGSDGEPLLADVRPLTEPSEELPAEWWERYKRDVESRSPLSPDERRMLDGAIEVEEGRREALPDDLTLVMPF